MWNIVPIGYEWLLRWILILTTLIWTGMAGRVWNWDSCLIMAPLVFLALISLFYVSLVVLGDVVLVVLLLPLHFLSSMPYANLAIVLIYGALVLWIYLRRNRMSHQGHKVAVFHSVGAVAFIVLSIPVVGFLALAIGGRPPSSEPGGAGFITVLFGVIPLYVSFVLALLVVLWIAMMSPIWRKIFVSVVGLWVIYMAVGWFWLIAMDNGLHAFAGEERVTAEVALDKAERSFFLFDPSKPRVVRDGDGQFDVVFYTWWGLKARRQ